MPCEVEATVGSCDFLVIGCGIAGSSAAAELAAFGRVAVLERESQPGYHASGRSAAMFTETYGPPAVRRLTAASRALFEAPPAGFAANAILGPRGILLIGRSDQLSGLQRALDDNPSVAGLTPLTAREAVQQVPVLRQDYVAGAVLEPEAMDIDVHALHQGFLRMLRARDGELLTNAEVRQATWTGGHWKVETKAGTVEAGVLIDAAGAWADDVAARAGVQSLGLTPYRRTAILFDGPPDLNIDRWPLVCDVDEQFYFKPEGGRVLASPADETASPPCDAQPEELDVAVAVDRLHSATTMAITRISHKRAGLRTFSADKAPAVGWDTGQEAFFWLAGQGGFGIQTSPALARATASLVRDRGLPSDLVDRGVAEADLSPRRLQSEG